MADLEANRRKRENARDDLAQKRYTSANTQMALMAQDISYIKDQLDSVVETVSSKTVNPDQFDNLKARVSLLERLVYGFVGLVLVAVIVAILALVVHTSSTPTAISK